MRLNDRPADGESDAEPFSFRRYEGMENVVGELPGHAVAMIDHGDTNELAVIDHSRDYADTFVLTKAAPHGIYGVTGQVEEYLLKLDGITG
jgi:hypothetical protein